MTSAPIRTLIVDDHPAIRAGVAAVAEEEHDITVVGTASGERHLWRTLAVSDPNVVLMDFELDGEDGVILCHRVKRRPDAPAVILYSAFADRTLIAPAMPAHADALRICTGRPRADQRSDLLPNPRPASVGRGTGSAGRGARVRIGRHGVDGRQPPSRRRDLVAPAPGRDRPVR